MQEIISVYRHDRKEIVYKTAIWKENIMPYFPPVDYQNRVLKVRSV